MKTIEDIKKDFEKELNIANVNVIHKKKADENYVAIEVGAITNLYAKVLNDIDTNLPEDSEFKNKLILIEKKPPSWLISNETKILQQLLSRALTVGKDNLNQQDYYIPFVEQESIKVEGTFNTIIYGRRGAGKSSLLLNMAKHFLSNNIKFVWIEMQQFNKRDDYLVIPQFLYELVNNLEMQGLDSSKCDKIKSIIFKLEEEEDNLSFEKINIKIPLIIRELASYMNEIKHLYIFLDDFHSLSVSFQPMFLSLIYSICRGNAIYLKVTTIENLTNLYNYDDSFGIQIPGDAQAINLDQNLIDPLKSYNHIENILNEYARYTGLPSIKVISGKHVLERLTWLSAGVPRDAIYIINNAITKALSKKRKEIALEDINMAASDGLKEKENYLQNLVGNDSEIINLLDRIKKFCFEEIRTNAFLIRIEDSDFYRNIKKISEFRFIHIIHPGITPEQAGKKYEAYLLDYSFYTGFRKAPSIKDYKSDLKAATSQELRKLKVFKNK